jgi:hypothetical protein
LISFLQADRARKNGANIFCVGTGNADRTQVTQNWEPCGLYGLLRKGLQADSQFSQSVVSLAPGAVGNRCLCRKMTKVPHAGGGRASHFVSLGCGQKPASAPKHLTPLDPHPGGKMCCPKSSPWLVGGGGNTQAISSLFR